MTDPQSRAYREAGPGDQWDGDIGALLAEGGAYRDPITDVGHVVPPDEFEAAGWDEGREPPKSPGDARMALLARIGDPRAPDTEDEAMAYDGNGI
jgi:hypothetical protein